MPDKPPPPPAPESNELESFVASVRTFMKNVGSACVAAAGNDPAAELVSANVQMITGNMERTLGFLSDQFAAQNPVRRREVMDSFAATDVVSVPQLAERTAVQQLKIGKVGTSLLKWLSGALTEIKKIIGMILEWILGFVPKWWDKLALLIDELWNLVMSLLAEVFGFDVGRLSREMSMAEVNHLNELAAATRLQAERTRALGGDED